MRGKLLDEEIWLEMWMAANLLTPCSLSHNETPTFADKGLKEFKARFRQENLTCAKPQKIKE
jgi:hypothetical protein